MPKAATTKTKSPTKTTTKTVSRPVAKTVSKNPLARKLNFKSPQMWAVIALVAAVGGYLIYRSFAATPPGNGMIAYECSQNNGGVISSRVCVTNSNLTGSRLFSWSNAIASSLVWSSDGQKLYTGYDNGIMVSDATGSSRRTIYFQATSSQPKVEMLQLVNDTTLLFRDPTVATSNLYAINVDGSNLRTLINDSSTPGPSGNGSLAYAPAYYQVSPDNTKILAVKQKTGDSTRYLYLYNVDGTNEQKLFAAKDAYANYSWSPDGQLIEIATTHVGPHLTDLNFAINKVRIDGTLVSQLAPTSLTAQYCGNYSGFSFGAQSWSPDGSKMLFACAFPITNRGAVYTSKLLQLDMATKTITAVYSAQASESYTPAAAAWQPDPFLAKQKYGWYVSGVGYLGQYGGANLGDIPAPADYSGDGTSDAAVFRPTDGKWYVKGVAGYPIAYGAAGDAPMPGDFNGDGKAEPAVFRKDGLHDAQTGGRLAANYCMEYFVSCPPVVSNISVPEIQAQSLSGTARNTFMIADYVANPVGQYQWQTDAFLNFSPFGYAWHSYNIIPTTSTFGVMGDILAPGRYIDAKMHLAVWRPSNGTWYVLANGKNNAVQWGQSGDIPMPGDYNGDGISDYAVYRPSNGYWYVKDGRTQAIIIDQKYGGLPGDMPIHFVLHGKTVPAVVRRES